jgi:ssDNA thymidine ADP-ribosyltransferase, DarT
MTAVDQAVLDELDARGITEVRHFTTSRGLLGALTSRRVLSRRHLAEEEQLRLIAMNNCYRRWDTAWFGHVSLSIQRINGYLYGISSGRWHVGEDLWWAVLGLDRAVLAHPDVVFATTNNGYSVVRRAMGEAGLKALFAEEVTTWEGNAVRTLRRTALTPNQTTCPQAEALYPEAVDTSWLRTIYVPQPELADTVHGWLAVTDHPPVDVVFDPEAFA